MIWFIIVLVALSIFWAFTLDVFLRKIAETPEPVSQAQAADQAREH